MPTFSIGVDLGGTNLRIAAVDGNGTLLEKVTLGTGVSRGRARVIQDMCDAIHRLTRQYEKKSSLVGVGIGIPGIIDVQTGIMRESPNLPGWEGALVKDEIEKCLQSRAIVDNDANVAALGEKWLGAGKQVDHLAILTLGTGVGGGLVFNGRIWTGMSGMAGEAGHTTVEPDGVKCGCGNRGCLEQYASATAIVRMAKEAVAAGAQGLRVAAGSDAEFSARAIYNLAIQGDEDARKIFQQVGRCIGIVLSNLVNILNLPMYVIGGGVSSAWEAFAPAIFAELRQRSMVYAATAPDSSSEAFSIESMGASAKIESTGPTKTIITRALLGSDAGLYGAARLPMIMGS
ncbi:MAG: ROK family protein [Terriglobales bacterium]